MKSIRGHIIKDFAISILIVICIVVVFAVFFYDEISLGKVIPEAEEYSLTEEMKKEIEDNDLKDVNVETEEEVIKYYIDASDLKKYEKTNEYNKGKKNPFSAEGTSVENGNTTSNTITSDSNANSGFYEDDCTK